MTTTHDDDSPDGSKNTGNHGRWDPFKTFRRFVSPEERMQLLMMKRPVQPPEDFMNTVELKLMRSTQLRDQLRHLSPALIGLGTLLVVLVVAVFWWQPWLPPTISPAQATALKSDVTSASKDDAVPVLPSANPIATSGPIAQPSAAAPATAPAVAAPRLDGTRSPRPASAEATVAPASRNTASPAAGAALPPRAPKVQTRAPEDLDLDTPMAPPVH